jgi:uncharacterized membrane protein
MALLRRKLLFGGCMTIAGVLLLLICDWMPQFRKIVLLSGVLIPMGLMLIVLSLITTWYEKKADVIDDERTLKIRAHTYMKAFSFSITFAIVLSVLIYSKVLVMDAGSAIMAIFFIMILSSSLLYWYYNRQGDINGE